MMIPVVSLISLATVLQWVNGSPSNPNHLHRHGHHLPRNATRSQNSVLSHIDYPEWLRYTSAPKKKLLANSRDIDKKCGAHEYFSEKRNRCLQCSCCNVVSRHDKTKKMKLTPLTACTSNSHTLADFACSQDFSWVCDVKVQNDTTKPPKSTSSSLKYPTLTNALLTLLFVVICYMFLE